MLERVTDRAILWAVLVLHVVGAGAILWLCLTLNLAVGRQAAIRDGTMERLLELDGRMRRIERNLGLTDLREDRQRQAPPAKDQDGTAPAPGGR